MGHPSPLSLSDHDHARTEQEEEEEEEEEAEQEKNNKLGDSGFAVQLSFPNNADNQRDGRRGASRSSTRNTNVLGARVIVKFSTTFPTLTSKDTNSKDTANSPHFLDTDSDASALLEQKNLEHVEENSHPKHHHKSKNHKHKHNHGKHKHEHHKHEHHKHEHHIHRRLRRRRFGLLMRF